jgi:hypothetical protein
MTKKRQQQLTLDEVEARFARVNKVAGMTARGAYALVHQGRRQTIPLAATWADLIRNGGPLAHVRAAAWEAYREAARMEARRWLEQLEVPEDDPEIAAVVAGYIKSLKRIAGVGQTIEERRAQTKDRVRRWRERQKAAGAAR